MAARKKSKGLTWKDVGRIALKFPSVEESTSYGTPSYRAAKKFFTRLKEDGKSIVVRVGMDEREVLMELDPETFFITEHYRQYPAMLVNLATVHESQVQRLLEQSWRGLVSKKVLAAYDAGAKPEPIKRSAAPRRKR